jgi:DNA gyrase subunit B
VIQRRWVNTTHDWAASVDAEHLQAVREATREFAPNGVLHLVLEVLAYAADEAESKGMGRAAVTLNADGSVIVADDGRGTDTRRDENGGVVKKPVMATPDLRFFNDPSVQSLADGHPRRGMSVVAALSDWLVHENRRSNGAWRQRYERGVPVSDLVPLPLDGSTGTLVHFKPSPDIGQLPAGAVAVLGLSQTAWLRVDVVDARPSARGPSNA